MLSDAELTEALAGLPGWAREGDKHRLKAAVHVYESNRHKGALSFAATPRFTLPPILVINYEAIRSNKVIDLIDEYTSGRGAMLVVDELHDLQVFYGNLGGGEPMVRRDFFELLEYAIGRGVGVKFSTNGAFLDADKGKVSEIK